ncbi:hypothetical protein Hanom_Chr09g00863061 [Helianthus anomalus]
MATVVFVSINLLLINLDRLAARLTPTCVLLDVGLRIDQSSFLVQKLNTCLVSLMISAVRIVSPTLLQNRFLDGVIWLLRRCFQHRLKVHRFKIESY